MRTPRKMAAWLWKIPLCGAAHATGGVFGALATTGAGLTMPQQPVTQAPAQQALLAVAGGMVIAIGLAALATGMAGSWRARWMVLGTFAFITNGVSLGLETRIFTTLGGDLGMVLATLPGSLACGLLVALLFAPGEGPSFGDAFRLWRSAWRPEKLALRLVLALLAFPACYLVFGAIIAPVVAPHYARLDFLVIPSQATILTTQMLRSTLFLAVSVPLVMAWGQSRGQLAAALGLAHFACVGLNGLIQTPIFPSAARWAHGFEILGDSATYGLALAWLLLPPRADGDRALPTSDRPRVVFYRVCAVIAAVMCFAAIPTWPAVFYGILRVVVCVTGALGCVIAWHRQRRLQALALVAVVLLFNPLLSLPLGRGLWQLADLTAGIVFLASVGIGDRHRGSSERPQAGAAADAS